MQLPDGHTWRRATLGDAPAILPLVVEHNMKVVGIADCTLDDIRDMLTEPGMTLDTDTWLMHSPSGAIAGFGWAMQKGASDRVDIELLGADQVRSWLYRKLLTRAAELVDACGHAEATLYQGIYREDATGRAAATAHGFSTATTFHRMRVDHGGAAPVPAAPPGVTLRTGPGDEEFRRTAHAVLNESFRDHFGWTPLSFEDWHETLERESIFDWSQLTVADLDGRPVGVLVTTDGFAETDNCGYVADIGVIPEARGRGIAKFLLRTAFAADVLAGRAGTILHVDTNNTTPALGLYEGVGMRAVLVIDMWRRTVPAKWSEAVSVTP